MKKTLLTSALCVAALSMAFTASAAPRFGQSASQGPSYDNFGVGYTVSDMDELDSDFDGYSIELEKRLSKTWYAGASYSSVSNKDNFSNIPAGALDIDSYLLGVGYIVPMSKTTSMDVFVGFAKQRAELDGMSASGDGYHVGINLRQRIGDLEWNISPAYVDLDMDGESESAFQVTLAGQYYLAPSVSLGAGVTVGEDANGLTVGLRYHF